MIVELKAVDKISGKEPSQVINYLKATGIERAPLFNFGTIHPEYHRLILGFKHQRVNNAVRRAQKKAGDFGASR